MLEIHVILLTFTDLRSRVVEQFQDLAEHILRSHGHAAVTVDAHHVAGENRAVFAPFGPDSRIAPAQR